MQTLAYIDEKKLKVKEKKYKKNIIKDISICKTMIVVLKLIHMLGRRLPWYSSHVLNTRIADFGQIVARAVLTVMWHKSTGWRDIVNTLHYYRIMFEKSRHLVCHLCIRTA